jgi:hypothetical protein
MQYWINVIAGAKWLSSERLRSNYEECIELPPIFASIGKGV